MFLSVYLLYKCCKFNESNVDPDQTLHLCWSVVCLKFAYSFLWNTKQLWVKGKDSLSLV